MKPGKQPNKDVNRRQWTSKGEEWNRQQIERIKQLEERQSFIE